jgi:Ala-tRNA(Pro) deacylase
MTVPRKLKQYLKEQGIEFETLEHSTAYTAQEIAAATHIKGKALAKAVIVKADDHMVMAVLPSDHKILLDKLGEVLHARQVEIAKEEEFKDLFPDCETGSQPPLGNLYSMDVIADDSLTESPDITFNAGTHHDVITMHRSDWEDLVHPDYISFSSHL